MIILELLKNRNVLIISIICFFGAMVFFAPVSLIFKLSRGLTLPQIFLVESISMIISVALEVPCGWISDKIGFKKAIVISLGIILLGRIMFLFSYSFWAFVAYGALFGVGFALQNGSDTSLLYKSVDKKDSEKAMGLGLSWFYAGNFIAIAVASVMLLFVPIVWTVITTVIASGLSFIVSFFLRDVPHTEEDIKERPNIIRSLKIFVADKKLVVLAFAIAIIAEIWRLVNSNLNQAQFSFCGIDVKYFGFIFIVLAAFPILSGKVSAFTAKFGQERLLKLLFAALPICLFVLALTGNAVLSIILIIIVTAAYPLSQPALTDMQQKSVNDINRVTMMSIFALVAELGAAGIDGITSAATKVSLSAGFWALGCLAAIALVLVFAYYRIAKKGNLSTVQGNICQADKNQVSL